MEADAGRLRQLAEDRRVDLALLRKSAAGLEPPDSRPRCFARHSVGLHGTESLLVEHALNGRNPRAMPPPAGRQQLECAWRSVAAGWDGRSASVQRRSHNRGWRLPFSARTGRRPARRRGRGAPVPPALRAQACSDLPGARMQRRLRALWAPQASPRCWDAAQGLPPRREPARAARPSRPAASRH